MLTGRGPQRRKAAEGGGSGVQCAFSIERALTKLGMEPEPGGGLFLLREVSPASTKNGRRRLPLGTRGYPPHSSPQTPFNYPLLKRDVESEELLLLGDHPETEVACK